MYWGGDKMSTIFLAGIYGVGKSTLAEKISAMTGLPYFSAGDLISKVNGEKYGANKFVTDKEKNQDILVECVSEILQTTKTIILAGHFCIVNRQGEVEKLPNHVFTKLQISKIVLLEAPPSVIMEHLSGRDGKNYPLELLKDLLLQEHECAKIVSALLQCPLIIHQMRYKDEDIEVLQHEL